MKRRFMNGGPSLLSTWPSIIREAKGNEFHDWL
jgi:hypothetical protein